MTESNPAESRSDEGFGTKRSGVKGAREQSEWELHSLCMHQDKGLIMNQGMISETFDWYLKCVLTIIEPHAIQQKYGYHGLYTHTAAVVFRGIDYALSLKQNPQPVVFACAFHDIARTHDGPDINHGANATPIIKQVLRRDFSSYIPFAMAIMNAVKNHTVGTNAPDYISACLWDADRTRLSWECGFDPCFFATDRAKAVASQSPDKYLEFMKNNMSQYAKGIIKDIDKIY